MIEREFLESLKGLETKQAKARIEDRSLRVMVMPKNAVASSLLRPDYIYLWEHNGVVVDVGLGDPSQVE